MKKVFLVLLVVLVIFSAVGCKQIFTPTDVKIELYHNASFDNLDSYVAIADYLNANMTIESRVTSGVPDLEGVFTSGVCTYLEYCALFGNIAYYGMGKELGVGTVNFSDFLNSSIAITGPVWSTSDRDTIVGVDGTEYIYPYNGAIVEFSAIDNVRTFSEIYE